MSERYFIVERKRCNEEENNEKNIYEVWGDYGSLQGNMMIACINKDGADRVIELLKRKDEITKWRID